MLDSSDRQSVGYHLTDHTTTTNGTTSGSPGPSPEPIAIVGYACRLPGEVSSPSKLWEMCTRGRSGWSKIPSDRFSLDAYYHPDASRAGTLNPTGGYFLQEDVGRFDAPFFNITAQEAISLDPQQRLLLECSYEAFESAGFPKESLAGRNVGVFVGGNPPDYEVNNIRDLETAPMHQSTGCSTALQSNRISYVFDLRGPSFTVETACSASLVALHSAMQSLRSGESTEALVGGCRLNLLPDAFVVMSMSQLFNDDGKTFAFDHRANSGFARGEGAGVVILKPLSAALRDRDPIRAVIANSGVNQDGKTQGITNPNRDAQADLIRKVYAEASLNPDDCGFVEMHGTGTKVGDPIEAGAVHDVLGTERTARNPLYIGSVKTNIGHLEGGSGVVSIIKGAMMLENDLMLPNADFQKPNPNIPLDEWNMKVLKSTRPWPRGKKYLSVSNYGFGGTNTHVVLQKAPQKHRSAIAETLDDEEFKEPKRKLIVISANDRESLQTKASDLGVYFQERLEVLEKSLFGDLAYTLGDRRSHLLYRVAVPVENTNELGVRLAQMNINPPRVLGTPRVGFVFTGQGAQWAQMGIPLMEEYPVFASAMRRADKHLHALGAEFSLIEEMQKDPSESQINSPHLSQPTCTALQVALVLLLKSWGIEPSSVVGHSSGEIGAAFAAGAYGLEEAVALAYHRGRMTQLLKDSFPDLKGTMLAVGASRETITPMIKGLKNGYTTVACVNSPSSVTVSGDVPAIAELEAILEEKQLFNRRLKIDVAYHSEHMQNVAEAYLSSIESIKPSQSDIVPFYSSVFGVLAEPAQLDPSYWVKNLTSSVLFSDALGQMCGGEERPNILIEIGPHSALKGPIMDTLKVLGGPATKIAYSPTVVRKQDALESVLNTAAAVFVRGGSLDMNAVNFPHTRAANHSVLTDLPTYPWQHKTRYWHEARIPNKHLTRDGPRNDILGQLANYSNDLEPTWRNIIRLDELPWLRDHKMQGVYVFPLAAYMSMAVEAAQKLAIQRGVTFSKFEFREVVVGSALVLRDDTDAETTITLRPYTEATRAYSDAWDEFRVCSWVASRGWTEHCRGLIGVRGAPAESAAAIASVSTSDEAHVQSQINKVIAASSNPVGISSLYDKTTELGAGFGPTFRGLENGSAGLFHSYGDVAVRDTKSIMPKEFETPLVVHPALLDAVMHVLWMVHTPNGEALAIPTYLKHATITRNVPHVAGELVSSYCAEVPSLPSSEIRQFDFFATRHGSNEVVIDFEGLVTTIMKPASDLDSQGTRKLCHRFEWQPLSQQRVKEEETEAEEVVTNGDAAVNGHAEPNGHAESNGNAETNGHAEPNGDVLTNGHAAATTNGHTPSEKEEIILASFADSGIVTDSLQAAITRGSEYNATVGRLGEIECEKKRVVIVQAGKDSLRHLNEPLFESIRKVLLTAASVLWVYRNDLPDAQMSAGLARSVRLETMAKIATLGLDPADLENDATLLLAAINTVWPVSGPSSFDFVELEFKAKAGELHVLRALEDEDTNSFILNETQDNRTATQPFEQAGRRFKIQIGTPGALDTLHFIDESPAALKDNEVEIKVHATGVNFKDVMVTMGQLTQPFIGVECSGVVAAVGKTVTNVFVGQRVMAMPEGAYSTYARCPSTNVAAIPEHMSFEEAATVPVVFCTAYYALFDQARLTSGEKVLIHAGAGGVGQAAIMLAQMAKADVFVTVGSIQKKEFLMTQYGIPENRIFYSRDTSFGRAIRRATDDIGVDVVLNSLAGDMLRETWACVAPFGRFVEIGKADITRNSRLEMAQFEYNVSFSSVDLSKASRFRPGLMQRLMDDVCRLMRIGMVKPVSPITVYSMSEVETAFRTLQTGRNIGKVVVAPRAEDKVLAACPRISSGILRPDASYILVGGTGGLGRSMAKWMSSKGARHIVLSSRTAKVSEKVEKLINELAKDGTTVVVKPCDIGNAQSVETLIREDMKDMPPVRGVVHGAMVLRDTLFENMTLDDFQGVATCKVEGAWNLHQTLADSPLDFFIALSSLAGVVGNLGQGAYSAANVFLDGFMEFRRSQGLPGTSIDLAAVSDVGYIADSETARRDEVLRNVGSQTIDESEVLALVGAAITGQLDRSCAGQCITGLGLGSMAENYWLADAKFTELREAMQDSQGNTQLNGESLPLREVLKAAESKEAALEALYQALAAKLAEVLVMSTEDLDPSLSISSLGLDSLVGIEVRNWIAREADANVQILELLSTGSIMGLAQMVLSKSGIPRRYE